MQKAQHSMNLRWDYWRATWKMIADERAPLHFWLGVGPGSFGRFYPRYMAVAASEKISDPHNLVLEIWATAGLFALIGLLAALGFYFWDSRALWSRSFEIEWQDPDQNPPTGPSLAQVPLVICVGAMAGLILAFALWAKAKPPDQVIGGGILAITRMLIWVAAFAALASIPWGGRSQRLVLTAGVAALLINLLVSGGISFPSVAQPLWIVMALSSNVNASVKAPRQALYPSWLPVLVVLGACVAYGGWIFSPVWRASTFLKRARDDAFAWRTTQSAQLKPSKDQSSYTSMRQLSYRYLQAHLIAPLLYATQLDPGDAVLWNELADWFTEMWKYAPTSDARDGAAAAAQQVTQLDPEGKEGYLTKYQMDMTFARGAENEAKSLYGFAATNLLQVVKRDPTEARLRYLLAEVLLRAGKPEEARMHAARARELDQATDPSRQLSADQRARLEKWLGQSASAPD
jgi:tetratricopeptide (TPR) repeat protein